MAEETEVETVVRLHAVDVRDLYPSVSAEDTGSRVCCLCAMKLKDKTHNLTRHLERHHPAALLQLMEQRDLASPTSSTRRAGKKAKASIATQQVDEDSTWDARMADANRALAMWLAHEELPIDLVETPDFRAFMTALNAQFRPSEPEELPVLLSTLVASDMTTDVLDLHESRAATVVDAIAPTQARVLRAVCRNSDEVPLVVYQTVACRPLRAGEARVRVLCAAGSLTDALTCRGKVAGRNGILGKALVGVVTTIPSEPRVGRSDGGHNLKTNDKVVVSPYLACEPCQQFDQPAVACQHCGCLGVRATTGALAEYVTVPIANLHVVPPSIPNELLLVADDMSTSVAIANEISQRQLKTIAVVTDAHARCLASVIEHYLRHSLQHPIHSVFVTSMTADSDISACKIDEEGSSDSTLVIPLDLHRDTRNSVTFDAVVDLCGTEQSIAFAVNATRPMGCLILVDRSRFDVQPRSSLALDVNAVVVNELELVTIEDCRAEMSDAIQYIAEQAQDPSSAAELRRLVSTSGVMFPAALHALESVEEVTFESQYLLVEVTDA